MPVDPMEVVKEEVAVEVEEVEEVEEDAEELVEVDDVDEEEEVVVESVEVPIVMADAVDVAVTVAGMQCK